MSRPLLESQAFRYDLADRIDWYEQVQAVPPKIVDGFLESYETTRQRIIEWPNSGRMIRGAIPGLQELNLPRPYGHYLLLFVTRRDDILILRLIHTS